MSDPFSPKGCFSNLAHLFGDKHKISLIKHQNDKIRSQALHKVYERNPITLYNNSNVQLSQKSTKNKKEINKDASLS